MPSFKKISSWLISGVGNETRWKNTAKEFMRVIAQILVLPKTKR